MAPRIIDERMDRGDYGHADIAAVMGSEPVMMESAGFREASDKHEVL